MSIVAIGLALIGAAYGDPAIGSRLNPGMRRQYNADMGNPQETMFRFTECTVTLNEGRMRTYLDTRSQVELEKASQAFDQSDRASRCNTGAVVGGDAALISFGSDLGTLRGMTAEAFLRKYKIRTSLAALAPQRTYPRDWHAMTGRPVQIDQMATCVAAVNPAGIMAITKTEFGSKKEKKAIDALAPTVGQCLAAGYKMTTNQLGLRTALAEALYHRVFDVPPASANAQ